MDVYASSSKTKTMFEPFYSYEYITIQENFVLFFLLHFTFVWKTWNWICLQMSVKTIARKFELEQSFNKMANFVSSNGCEAGEMFFSGPLSQVLSTSMSLFSNLTTIVIINTFSSIFCPYSIVFAPVEMRSIDDEVLWGNQLDKPQLQSTEHYICTKKSH